MSHWYATGDKGDLWWSHLQTASERRYCTHVDIRNGEYLNEGAERERGGCLYIHWMPFFAEHV